MIVGALLLLLALIGAPLFAVIAASALLGFHSEEIDLAVVAIEFYRLAEMPVLLAIPHLAPSTRGVDVARDRSCCSLSCSRRLRAKGRMAMRVTQATRMAVLPW